MPIFKKIIVNKSDSKTTQHGSTSPNPPAAASRDNKNISNYDLAQRYLNIAGEHKTTEYHENNILCKDGKERVIARHNTVLKDAQSKIVNLLSSGEDITERKQVEDELRESEEKLRIITHNLPIGIYYIDFKGNILYANKAAEEITGYKFGEVQKQSVMKIKLFSQKDNARVAKNLALDVLGINSGRQEFELTRKDGKIIQVETDSKIVKMGGQKVVLGFLQDISERMKKKQEVEESRGMLQKIIDLLPTRIFWKDTNLNYLGCNLIFAKDAGKSSPAELIGKSDYEMGWKEQADIYRKDDLKVINSGESKINYEEPQTAPNGDRIWLLTTKVPLKNKEDSITGILGTYLEITDKKKAEVELEARNSELERANKIMIGRELKMIELKEKIKNLESGQIIKS